MHTVLSWRSPRLQARSIYIFYRFLQISAEIAEILGECSRYPTPSADFCRNLRFLQFLQKSKISAISAEIWREVRLSVDFCRKCAPFCRNFIFLQKGYTFCRFLRKSRISANPAESVPILQISAEILNFCRKCTPFCRFLQKSAEGWAFALKCKACTGRFASGLYHFCRNVT